MTKEKNRAPQSEYLGICLYSLILSVFVLQLLKNLSYQ